MEKLWGKEISCRVLLAFAFLLLSGHSSSAQQAQKTSPAGTRYLLYTPPGYTPADQYPVLIVLHGQGGMGDNLNLLLNRDDIPSKLIHEGKWPDRYPFIVVSPQLKRDPSVPDPADQLWPPEMIDEVLDDVRSEYSVNQQKIYITGLSQGAHGSYDYAVTFPEKIAALAIISGVPDSTKACSIKDIPVWVFHGTDDSLVPPVFASGLIRALDDCKPARFTPHLNMLYGRRHEGWNEVYNNAQQYNIYDWMLKFTKNSTTNTAPYVNAGGDLTVAQRNDPLHLYGEYFDSDGTIAQVLWRQISGPPATMSGVSSRFVKLSQLVPGNYEFELRVTDNNGAPATDRVAVKVVSGNSGMAVTGLTLLDGRNQNVISVLKEGFVINPETLFRNQINIQATVSGNVGSVRFKVNSNENARTIDSSPYRLANPRWTLQKEQYLVCATPYSGREGSGTEGTSLCYTISVSSEGATPPEEPEEPVDPEEPEEPVDPEEPEEPVDPEEPEEPEEPVDPGEPEEPVDPEEPLDPEEPDEPEEPVDPEEPEQPEEPVDPEEPEQPEEPVEPEEPVDPEEPEEPGEPIDPEDPEEPVDPEEPEQPVDPQEPEPPGTPVTHFYAKAGTDISQLSSWSSNVEGSGSTPLSFSGANSIFDVVSQAELNHPLTLDGANAVLRIRSGGDLTLNHQLIATIHMEAQAILRVNTAHPVQLGSLHATSQVHFLAPAIQIPARPYGHLFLEGNGTTKQLGPGVTYVAGNLNIGEGVLVNGADEQTSTIALSGNLAIAATNTFAPQPSFAIAFEKGATQQFAFSGSRIALHALILQANTLVNFESRAHNTVLELGSGSGGGLIVGGGGKLLLHSDELVIAENGTINPANETGQVGFRKSSLRVSSSANLHSNLYTVPGADSVVRLNIALAGTGNLILHNRMFVAERADITQGTIVSNGNLSLVSTAAGTAVVHNGDGQGKVSGALEFQRFVPAGSQTRYLSFPVSGITVADLQASVPVTGDFVGSSDPAKEASLQVYEEAGGEWIAFPEQHHTESLQVGRGYALTIPQETQAAKLRVSGPLQQGDFTWSLAANPGNDPAKGWNLIGNPYAFPVRWADEGWSRQGVGTAAYVLDDRHPGGRFLVWDGTLGDEEFAGVLAQGQGFFVRTTSDTPVLAIGQSAIADTSGNFWRPQEDPEPPNHMTITLARGTLIDRTYVKFSNAGEDEFDASDAVKRENGYFSLSSLSSDSVSLAINHLKETFCDRTIGLMIATETPGTYTLSFSGSQLKHGTGSALLVDHFTGKEIALQENPDYDFQVTSDPASSGKKRFEVRIPSGTLEKPLISVEGNVLISNITNGNQWLFNGEVIEGATGSTFYPEESGAYSLSVTMDGCSRQSESVFVTVSITGLEQQAHEITIFPNPASEAINIRLGTPPAGQISYVISNAMGQQVSNGALENTFHVEGRRIPVSNLGAGIYFLTLRSSGRQHQMRFVIDR